MLWLIVIAVILTYLWQILGVVLTSELDEHTVLPVADAIPDNFLLALCAVFVWWPITLIHAAWLQYAREDEA